MEEKWSTTGGTKRFFFKMCTRNGGKILLKKIGGSKSLLLSYATKKYIRSISPFWIIIQLHIHIADIVTPLEADESDQNAGPIAFMQNRAGNAITKTFYTKNG